MTFGFPTRSVWLVLPGEDDRKLMVESNLIKAFNQIDPLSTEPAHAVYLDRLFNYDRSEAGALSRSNLPSSPSVIYHHPDL